MKTLAAVAVVLLVAFVLTRAAATEFGWREVMNETVSLAPGAEMTWTLPAAGQYTLETTSQYAVRRSFVPPVDDGLTRYCRGIATLAASTRCTLPDAAGPYTLAVLDERDATQTVAESAIAIWTRSAQAANRATEPNRVSIRVAKWDCIKNCPR